MGKVIPDVPLFTSVAAKSGACILRDGHNKLDYEIHGTGSEKIVLIMGLLASRYSWRETVRHFMSKSGDDYSILVFDNRGVGRSSAPWGRYTTSMLAADVLDLLDHLGWNQERSIHVNGVSMGGMVSLELALLCGSRIKSLTLTSTCAKHQNPPRTRAESALGWINFFKPKSTFEAKALNMMDMLFVDEEWLSSPAEESPSITNRENIYNLLMNRLRKGTSPPFSGQVGQLSACLTHNCSFTSLAKLGEIIPDTLIITGAKDKMIDPQCSDDIYREMSNKGSQTSLRQVIFPSKGHALAAEAEKEYHKEVESIMNAGNMRWAAK